MVWGYFWNAEPKSEVNNASNVENNAAAKQTNKVENSASQNEHPIVTNQLKESVFLLEIKDDYTPLTPELADVEKNEQIASNLPLVNSLFNLEIRDNYSLEKNNEVDNNAILNLQPSEDVNGNLISTLKVIENYDADSTPNPIQLNQESLNEGINHAYDPKKVDPIIRAMQANNGFPVKNRKLEDFQNTNQTKSKDKCSHETKIVTRLTGKGNDKKYVLKYTDPEMACLEAISNAFYRRWVSDVVSSSNAVHDHHGYTAVASRIKNFKSFREQPYHGDTSTLSDDQIKKLAQILVSSYIFEEDDLHRGNIGLEARIDFDMSFWTILRKRKGNRFIDNIPKIGRDTETTFKLTEKNIREFPDIDDDNGGYYWVTKTGNADNNFSKEENNFFRSLKNHPVFMREKFKVMLKFLLIMDVKSSTALCHLHVNPSTKLDGDFVTDLFVNKIEDRKTELSNVLLGMPEFYAFMIEYGSTVLDEIKTEVGIANKQVKRKIDSEKAGYEKLEIDMRKLQSDFDAIKEDVVNKKTLGFDIVNADNQNDIRHYMI